MSSKSEVVAACKSGLATADKNARPAVGISYPAQFDDWMRQALQVADGALASGDVPVGALLLDASGGTVAAAHNEREKLHDPTAHAEVLALRRAAETAGSWRLEGLTLVVTLEPCVMCAGAIAAARISRVVFGAWDEKAGASGSVHDLLRDRALGTSVEVVGGVLATECAKPLESFFASRR